MARKPSSTLSQSDSGGASGSPVGDAAAPSDQLGFVLLPNFNALATMAAIDPFRATNYVSATKLYQWTLFSLDGAPVRASNGVEVAVDAAIGSPSRLDSLFLCASWTPEAFRDKRLFGWMRQLVRRGTTLGGIDTGAVVLAHAGLLNGYRATAHYEHLDGLKEMFPEVEVSDQIVVFDRDRVTCCGGAAATDMALEMIRLRHGLALANAAARYIFHDRLRSPGESQLHPNREPVGAAVHGKLMDAILLMERSIDQPIRLPALAKEAGLSLRNMERLFRTHTGVTPARYYLNLRLDRARGFITQTELRVLEVAIACGFKSAEHLTRAYKQRFNVSPRDDRVVGRTPFQFRATPLHASLPEDS